MPFLAMRALPAPGNEDNRNQFLPYGLVGLALGLVLLCLLPILFVWRSSRRSGADSAITATGREPASPTMSADTVSALFPDRPIRPLPKRRLRERLSPDVADSIEYPPAPESSTSLFYYPYSPREEDSEPAPYGRRETRPGLQGPAIRDGPGQESDDDAARMSRIASLAINMSDSMSRSPRTSTKQGQGRQTTPHPPPSAASSSTSLADGYYDPFEITNNKKKRKIPTAGDSVLNGNHGVHNGANGAESPGTPIPSIEGHGELSSPVGPSSYVGTNSHYSGIHNNLSGPGRGRYGRVRKGRSPLRALTEGSYNLNWANRNGNGKLRPSQWVSPSSE
ncbi:hypothetical protein GE09DRAFT_404095 [Coniochaeta sp. 2T2.1]|nr:hypothetical protein GE09DRAFT_404095 [Coniochaeta sp. 2T2.1]